MPEQDAVTSQYMTGEEIALAIKPALDLMQKQGNQIRELQADNRMLKQLAFITFFLITILAIGGMFL